jgi:hypothetical protein
MEGAMNRDPIVVTLLAAILLTGVATTALLFEERLDRHQMAREAKEASEKMKAETDKMLAESKAFTDKMLKDMPKIPGFDPDPGRPNAEATKADSMKELHCVGEVPNRKCDWK